jgi:hypothetical protein
MGSEVWGWPQSKHGANTDFLCEMQGDEAGKRRKGDDRADGLVGGDGGMDWELRLGAPA